MIKFHPFHNEVSNKDFALLCAYLSVPLRLKKCYNAFMGAELLSLELQK